MKIQRTLVLFAGLVLVGLLPGNVQAEVMRVDIGSRADLLGGRSFGRAGTYEKIIGKVTFAVDPNNPHNQSIVDLDKAPRNVRGEVEFSADLYILKPKDLNRGNGAVLFEVSNRGGKGMLSFFNRARGSPDPSVEAEIGDGFLMRLGFTLVWVGWQFDVPLQDGLMRLYAPITTETGKPIAGLVRADFVLPEKVYDHSLADANHLAYPVLDPQGTENILTVRDTIFGQRRELPRSEWQFARIERGTVVPDLTRVYLQNGFEPGKIYEVVYRSQNPVVLGLGLAAVRDLIAYFKHQPDAVVPLRRAYAFGISQSGRFLRHFLYQGFNADEHNRQVFDGVIAHVAGGGRGSFNHRFAQPSRAAHPFEHFFYPTDLFPFTDIEQTDPETGETDGLLTHAKNPSVLPKIFYTNASSDYWGRAVSLTHTTVDGTSDALLRENVRIYSFAGSQHVQGPFFPPTYSPRLNFLGQQKLNSNDFRWSMRALLLAMDRWVSHGTPPPPSQYPRIADGTLVRLQAVEFPKLPGIEFPQTIHEAYRVDYGPQFPQGIVSEEPPRVGRPFPVLVPQVDRDGNERAGIGMPEIAVPLATYTGWNLRDPKIGAPNELVGNVGSYIPFARTRAERERTGDPRLAIEERYQSRAHYLDLYAEVALQLVKEGYLLAEDIPALLTRAGAYWDYATR
jgi:hypothetical protein